MGNYSLYKIAYVITRALPRRAAYFLAILLADCHYLFSKADARAVEANLKVILNTDQVPPAQVRMVFHNFGKYLADFLTMTKHVNADFIKSHVKMEHAEFLNEVLSHGKGCILVSAHLGNWELAGGVLSRLGYPLSVIALPHQDKEVNKFFNDQREECGATVISSTMAVRRCMEHVRDNRFVAILADRDFNQHGIVMDFLGKPTSIPKGAAVFSLRTGAPVIMTYFIRDDKDNFHVVFEKPIYPPAFKETKGTDEDLKPLLAQYLKSIEEKIRAYPTQWLIFREFWAK